MLRHSARSLLKSPGYTFVALVTLALGIGVNTSMFSVVDTLLFRSAPYPEPERLVLLERAQATGPARAFSPTEINEITPQVQDFSSLTVFNRNTFTLVEPGRPAERIGGLMVSEGVLDTLRIQPLHGRMFAPEEFTPGKNQVVLLSEAFWHTRFGGDRGVLGRTLRVDGETVTIIGILPARADYNLFWGNVGLWRPLNYTADQLKYRGYRSFLLIGRLRDGASPEAITAQLAPLAARQEKEFPQDYPALRYRLLPFHAAAMDDLGRIISWMLLGLSGFILLIACANLANLQLARATGAIREFAVRAALGASRGRLVAQQLGESILLAVAGGGLGLGVAWGVNQALEHAILIDGVPSLRIPIDPEVFAITLGVSLFTGALFGLVPAIFASRTDVTVALKSQSRGSTASRGHQRLRHALIIGELALALVLLGGAAVMNRGFARMLDRPVGWDTGKILTAAVSIPESRYDGEKRTELFRRVEQRLLELPGVEHVGLATSLPLFGYGSARQVFIDAPAGDGTAVNPTAAHAMIAGGYFKAMGIRLLEGRELPGDLKPDGPQYIIVNESLARHFWPGQSALGRRLGVMDNATGTNQVIWREVIGVAADVDAAANIRDPETRFTVYRPLSQEPWSFFNLVVRSEQPGALVETIRQAMSGIDPDLPVDSLSTVRQFIGRTNHNLFVISDLLAGFAALGVVLAAVGLYGVISFLVAQRTGEFGIRLALGARPADLVNHVVGRGARLAVIGLALGLVGAYGMARFLGSFMPRIAEPDPVALGAVALGLLVVALLASWVPARRAAKVDPMVALRSE